MRKFKAMLIKAENLRKPTLVVKNKKSLLHLLPRLPKPDQHAWLLSV